MNILTTFGYRDIQAVGGSTTLGGVGRVSGYALIRGGVVENTIRWDRLSAFEIPFGCSLRELKGGEQCSPGDTYDETNDCFVNLPEPFGLITGNGPHGA